MYCVRNVTDDLYWVGANDHRLALFENIHPIPRGVSYNAYLLLDEQTVLFDTVDWSACRQLLENIEHLLDGRPLSQYRGACPVQMIWQHPETVLDPLLPLGVSLNEAGAVEERLLEELHIQPGWLTRYPQELSGGELQRFCIARALGPATRYLLCDEITAMLDLITQTQIWDFLLREAQRRNLGLLIVSHSAPLLERVCTRIQSLSPIP